MSLIFILIIFFGKLVLAIAEPTLIVLEINNPTPIEIDWSSSVYIKDNILKIKKFQGQTVLVGKKEGYTYLKTHRHKINIQVLDSKNWNSYQKFNKIFIGHPSLRLSFKPEGALLEGEILHIVDWENLMYWIRNSDLKPSYDIKFLDTTLKFEALKSLSNLIGLNVTDIGLDFTIKSAKELSTEEIKKIEAQGLKSNIESGNSEPLGLLEITFINVDSKFLQNRDPFIPNEYQVVFNNKIKLLSQIVNSNYSESLLKESNKSTVQLMLFENEPTKYQSGGELAIQQRSIYRNDVQWKSYGLFIESKPQTKNAEETYLEIDIKISNLTSNESNQPSFATNSWTQKLKIKNDTSFIISNSLTDFISTQSEKNSIFKNIPILKHLFEGKRKGKDKANIYMIIKLNTRI